MSKVLVDPAALEEAAKWLEVHSSSSGSAEAFAAEALREAIAQPAEAEGVRDYLIELAEGEVEAKTAIEELQDALSAVTAERDRLREDRDSQQRVCIAEMEKANQLRAEVETLRKDAERYRWASSGVHEAETLVSIVNCHGGYAEKVAERVDVYREAAMAAKEA